MTQSADNLIWIDLEMTGLDPDADFIIEIATVVTDPGLAVLGEGPVIAISQPDDILNGMDEWNTRQHTRSGLVERVRNSSYTCEEAESMTLEFLQGFVPPDTSPMCGNSVCQDRRFLYRQMPALEKYFHYRNLDVSTLKELIKRWATEEQTFTKESKHLALADIHDSIEELKYYRERYFRL